MEPEIDLVADLNSEDDDGLGWSTLSDARNAADVRLGAMLVAGNRFGRAVVRVVSADEDGQVHFTVLPGSLEKNRHLIGRRALMTAAPARNDQLPDDPSALGTGPDIANPEVMRQARR